MRALIVSGLLSLCAVLPVAASDVALAIGNTFYRNAADVRSGDQPYFATRELSLAGIETISARNATSADTEALVEAWADAARSADGAIAVLSGRFVHSATETYFLPVDSQPPRLADMSRALPLSVVTAVLATHPGRAVLVLATDQQGRAVAYLAPGIGFVQAPQGVSVIFGPPDAAARFVRDTLAQPGEPLVAGLRGGLEGAGYLPDGVAFLEAAAPVTRPVPNAAEAWAETRQRDTIRAYEAFLARYPNSPFAQQARIRLNALLGEPNRRPRLAEESLGLTRDNRLEVQRALAVLGFDPRGLDGVFGSGTRNAIVAWQRDRDLAPTGYLDRYQINRLTAQARTREAELAAEREAQDRAFWSRTGATGSEAGLRAYLDRFPQGVFATFATQRLRQITDERRRSDEDRARREAEERDFWNRTGARGQEAGLRAYLQRFPEGVFAALALRQLAQLTRDRDDSARVEAEDRAYWTQTGANGSEAGYRAYLERYPQGLFAAEATQALAEITERSTTPEEAEREAFAEARERDTVPAYRGFLRAYPDSPFETEARARIAAIRAARDAPDAGAIANAQRVELGLGITEFNIRQIETLMGQAGYDAGKLDGEFDDQSRAAIRTIQNKIGVPTTGYLDLPLLEMILRGELPPA